MIQKPNTVNDRDQVRHIEDCFIKWLKVRYQNESWGLNHIEVDLKHSTLFPRLLAGDTFYPEPPPHSHSYPWYSLLDNGHCVADVWFDEDSNGDVKIIINQACWKLIEKISDSEYIVQQGVWICRIKEDYPDKSPAEKEKVIYGWTIELMK